MKGIDCMNKFTITTTVVLLCVLGCVLTGCSKKEYIPDADNSTTTTEQQLTNDASEVITNYTKEEIENSEYLYAIGETKPEYVVAKFNEKYNEVIITKNGKDSDGKISDMMDNNLESSNSPIKLHSDTLVDACIEKGIINIGKGLFSECKRLSEVVLPDSVISIEDNAFAFCSSLRIIKIPNSVISISDKAFKSCTSIKNIEIPNSVSSIGSETFENCSSLSDLVIGNSVSSIGASAFKDCASLTSVSIPDSVTRLEECTFAGCGSLVDICLPSGIYYIDDTALEGCLELAIIYGAANSPAEKWAKENGLTFVAITK